MEVKGEGPGKDCGEGQNLMDAIACCCPSDFQMPRTGNLQPETEHSPAFAMRAFGKQHSPSWTMQCTADMVNVVATAAADTIRKEGFETLLVVLRWNVTLHVALPFHMNGALEGSGQYPANLRKDTIMHH